MDPRQDRQKVEWSDIAAAVAFAQQYPGHLYILGDEPNHEGDCKTPTEYAQEFGQFVGQIRAVDQTARFSNGGFATHSCPGLSASIQYAQEFWERHYELHGHTPPIAEWRFHYFPDAANLAPFYNFVSAAAAWSVQHGAPMVLGSFGFPGTTTVDIRPQIRQVLNFLNSQPDVAAAIWWDYDRWIDLKGNPQHHSLTVIDDNTTLSIDGELFRDEYATVSVSPARSGLMSLGDFDGDQKADYADHGQAVSWRDFYVHRNQCVGSDVICFDTANWSTGTTARNSTGWDVLVADFTGDGKADFADLWTPTNSLWIHRNLGAGSPGFHPGNWASVTSSRQGGSWQILAADMDGDGRADLIEHDRATGLIWVRRNLGCASPEEAGGCVNNFSYYFNGGQSIGRSMTGPAWRLVVGNFAGPVGDRRADIADLHVPSGYFWVHRNVAHAGDTKLSTANWAVGHTASGAFTPLFGDFTGDGYVDYANWNPTYGDFYIHRNLQPSAPTAPGQAFEIANWGRGLSATEPVWSILGAR